MYSSVPTTKPLRVTRSSPELAIARAIPRSTRTAPPGDSTMLSGLMSRCAMPCACACSSASSTSTARRTTSAPASPGSPGSALRTRSIRSRPDMASRPVCLTIRAGPTGARLPRVPRLEVVQGDITQQAVDAIVNAANTTLLGGGGVDGAIHRAAGPELLEECRRIGGCPTGEARITGAYRLPARYVIHAVGPVWSGGKSGEPELLRGCYAHALRLAREHGGGLASVAFPSISTGAYRYPIEQAAGLAVDTVRRELREPGPVELVRFVCFSAADLEVYRRLLGA